MGGMAKKHPAVTLVKKTILVNFHCHSIFSDGELTPEILAANLATSGVRFAALTDHNSVEGLPRFFDALKKRNVTCISGVELTTQYEGREIHLLGYGFDMDHAELAATLVSLRQAQELEVQSIAGSLRKLGTNRSVNGEETQAVSLAPNGYLDIEEAIHLIHRAGGKVFLAHPLVYHSEIDALESFVLTLKNLGLDGIEAIYPTHTEEQTREICRLAKKHQLLICAGTDFHHIHSHQVDPFRINMPFDAWVQLRDALFSTASLSAHNPNAGQSADLGDKNQTQKTAKPKHFRRRSYVLRIFLPTLIAIALFLASIWAFILPSFERTLLERKYELIRELTNSAYSILVSYEKDESSGLYSREEAQALAVDRIGELRYGPEGKDYFWIQDMFPRMIMHPYRSDLNGQSLTNFTDPRGNAIFVEFAELVRREGEGYIGYVWQWNDDPTRLEPKQSYVKGFEPWGWVIGTGIYTDDVHQEIARIEQSLINTSLLISGAVVILLVFVLQQSLRIERERQENLDDLRESTERYHALIETTTEGTLLIMDDRCRYANPTFLRMTGYTTQQLQFLELYDLLPKEADNMPIWEQLGQDHQEPKPLGQAFQGILKQADGNLLESVISINPILFDGQQGIILLAKDLALQSALLEEENLSQAAFAVPVGIFRARAARRGTLLELNPAAQVFFGNPSSPQPALADLFSDPSEFDAFFETLQQEGEIQDYGIHQESKDAVVRFLSVSAKLVSDEKTRLTYIDGVLQDVTAERKQEAEREVLIEKLQASLLFLHEPISRLGRYLVIRDMHTPIRDLARVMTEQNVTAALVSSQGSAIIGIVTDHDLRARVLAEPVSLDAPIHTIMSAPITKIGENALIYEALNRMEEKGVRHLAVEDSNGQIINVIDNKSMIQFQRYGHLVITREISRAKTVLDVTRSAGLVPPLAKTLLDSSVRPQHVTNMLTSVCDTVTERLIELAVESLGPPPAAFAFIAMGSQGRGELTLKTDQDNGIIYTLPAESDPDLIQDYFLKLGERVNQGLNEAGYVFCEGQVMAKNARWCRSLPEWISAFDEWVYTSEPQEVINLSIFFDFRTVYGQAELTQELRRAVHARLRDETALFHHLAQNALQFKPPIRLLGNIYLSGGPSEHAGEINLKDAMMPIVSFARLYALRHQINPTHTLERINALCERNIILPASRDEIAAAYDFLMQLRLENQIKTIQAGHPPTNNIHPAKLGYIQQELLKQAFAQISAVQKKISYDFLGGV